MVVQKLEEKEGVLQCSLATLEKELAVRTQALELNKRKVTWGRRPCHHAHSDAGYYGYRPEYNPAEERCM